MSRTNDDEAPVVKVQFGKLRLALLSITSVGVIINGAFWLFSDKHNDERYVVKTDYARDRLTDAQIRKVLDDGLQRQFDEQREVLKTIQGDVKQLLREAKHQ